MTIALPPVERAPLPIRVAQFGTGVFLRGHIDWMIQGLNDAGTFGGGVAVIKLTPRGDLSAFERQSGAYVHVVRRGGEEPVFEPRVIDCVRAWVDPRLDWGAFVSLARSPDLRFVVSNATEAGVVYVPADPPRTSCPESFPARLAAFLDERRRALPEQGLIVLPLELIDDNGDRLREIVLRHGDDWELGHDFVRFVTGQCRFVNTLIDRIVAAPRGEDKTALLERLGVDDDLLNASEPYHFLGLETDDSLEDELPLRAGGYEVVYTGDLGPYRRRKVRILNGGHATLIFTGLLDGLEHVHEVLGSREHARFLEHVLVREVVPTLSLPADELRRYVDQVLVRFRNPILRHRMVDIRLNSLAKVKVRLLPAIADLRARGDEPRGLVLAFSAFVLDYLLAFAESSRVGAVSAGRSLRDDPLVVDAFRSAAATFAAGDVDGAVALVLGDPALFGTELAVESSLGDDVRRRVRELLDDGVKPCLVRVSG